MQKPAHILNVNDHEQTRYLVSRMLQIAGFNVTEAHTGEEALRRAAAGPDLVVLDVKLPDISGLEVCRMLKSRAETSSIFVLQTSATFVTAERKVAGLESGADGYLAHPFEPAELVATVQSLLRLKFAEEALRQRADELVIADRRKDEFLAMLAHELRNPLAAMTGAISLLEGSRTDPARFTRLRDVLQRQGKHLARLIDDLLEVSRMTRDSIELRQENCDIRAVLIEIAQEQRPALEARQQELSLDLADGMTSFADPTRLHQVFSNLIDNASKYSNNGARVRVMASRESKAGRLFARIRIADEGIGIAPAFIPRVFDLFTQADESLERSRGGLGIGLTLVKRLVELHGGEVEAHSSGLGKGSAFDVWLPLVEAQPAPVRVESAPRKATRKRSILIVEDNIDAAEMLEEFLRAEGHEVRVVHDGVSGVEAALGGQHDFGLVDIGLPELNGYQVAERIRAEGNGRPMVLVALTGYDAPEQQKRALEAGFDRHVVKPIDIDMLVRLLDELEPRHVA